MKMYKLDKRFDNKILLFMHMTVIEEMAEREREKEKKRDKGREREI